MSWIEYEVKYGVSTNPQTVDQETILAMAKLSNFNVVQQARRTGFEYTYRLLCNVCQEQMSLNRVVTKSDIEHDYRGKPYVMFCTDHAHRQEPVAVPATGRKFREE